jgi:hypothetical protein
MAEPGLDKWRERIYGILRSTGCDNATIAQAGTAMTSLIFGSVIPECFRARTDRDAELLRLTNLPEDDFESLRAIAKDYITSHRGAGGFDFGLAAIIAEVQRQVPG